MSLVGLAFRFFAFLYSQGQTKTTRHVRVTSGVTPLTDINLGQFYARSTQTLYLHTEAGSKCSGSGSFGGLMQHDWNI
jgi:hypothetical protein